LDDFADQAAGASVTFTPDWIQAWGTVAAALITLIGFGFVGWQIRQQRLTLENQTRWEVYQLSFALYKMLVDAPELRKYFYDKVPMPPESEARDRVMAAAELFLDYFENIWLSKKERTLDADTWAVWRDYMQYLHTQSPALKEFIAVHSARYNRDFRSILVGNEE
jgi:hypothetical protein